MYSDYEYDDNSNDEEQFNHRESHYDLEPKDNFQNNSIKEDASKMAGVMFVGTLLIQAVALLTIIITNLVFISLKPRRNYVQLLDGQVVEMGEMERNYRTPQTIRRFIFESLSLLFNWNGFKPMTTIEEANRPELDPGINVEKGLVPTGAYYASFAFRDGLRTSLLNQIAGIVPRELVSGVRTGGRTNPNPTPQSSPSRMEIQRSAPNVQTVLVIDFISNPKSVGSGKWEVDVVSTLLEIRPGRNAQEISKFNKTLVIVAVEPLTQDLTQDLKYYQPLINIRATGLQITEIKDLQL